jgi:hypothetical protein
MKVRKNKHKILDRMANPSWKEGLNKMWFIRNTERCKSYSPWCPDCNAKLFYKKLQRFPYSYEEWRLFELDQVAQDEVANKMLTEQRNQVDKELSDATRFLELSNQLEDFK